MFKIKTIAVCGAGTMGAGIAQTLICNGFKTIVYELNTEVAQKSKEAIFKNIESLVNKGKLSLETKEFAINHISFTSNTNEVVADIIIEAIIENLVAKVNLFKNLMAINKPTTIFATNTSSISINKIASALNQNKQIVGLHFFNPAPLMKLVEVIKSNFTSSEVVDTMVAFCKALQKTPVICNDAPGFIVNRVARHYYLQNMDLIEKENCSIEDLDTLMEAVGFKMGPFKLMDLIGLDINYGVSKIVFNDLDEPERLKPSIIQAEKVKEGKLGKKTGEGFYKY